MHERQSHKINELTRLVGSFIQYWGFKQIHGQIWAYVFLSKEPVDSTSLAKRLGVSKALVSLAVKDLLEYEVIRIAGPGKRRKILFESNPDQISVIIEVLKKRERKMLSQVKEACDQVKKNYPPQTEIHLDEERLEELTEMVETAQDFLENLIRSHLMQK